MKGFNSRKIASDTCLKVFSTEKTQNGWTMCESSPLPSPRLVGHYWCLKSKNFDLYSLSRSL